MLEVTGISNGIVIDHIPAGDGLKIFNKLFDRTNETVVLLMNVDSNKIGKKDIIKIENKYDVNLKILGLISEDITVNTIKNGQLVKKDTAKIPEKIKGFINCQNPRCISHVDEYAEPLFTLKSKNGHLKYACSYCEEITKYKF